MKHQPIWIRNARLIDPVSGRDEPGDLYVDGECIASLPARMPDAVTEIDGTGLVLAPGFIDIHVHLREPGGEGAETIATGSMAAARGGFTTIVAMPNTRPSIDTPSRVSFVRYRGEEVGRVRVLPAACITRNRAGEAPVPFESLRDAGAVAFTDDGSTVQSDEVMRRAMERAAERDLLIMDHAQDRRMEQQGGVLHDGDAARRFGLPGIPSEAEIRIVERDIRCAEETGCRLHIQHVSAAESVERLRAARARGVRVTAEATPHHIALCDEDIDPMRPDCFKMNPPLRSARDREAIIGGVMDGTLGIFATDHAPHTPDAKNRGFLHAPFGVVGLETAVGVTYTRLVRNGRMGLAEWIRRWTVEPARVLGRPEPFLRPGQPADLVLLDLENEWVVRADAFASRSRNTPFDGWRLAGRAMCTICAGRISWRLPAQTPA